MSHSRSPYRLGLGMVLLFAFGCGSGTPPLPTPLPPLPASKELPKTKKGAKTKGPVDSEQDPDSGHRTRRRMRQEAASKTE